MRTAILITTLGLFLGFATTGCSHLRVDTGNFWGDRAQLGSTENRNEVERAIERFRWAMVERRPDLILHLSAAILTFGHSMGVVQSREEFVEVIRSGAEIFKRIDLTDRRLTLSGDVAIERHHFSADIVYEGKLRNFELEVVEVWQRSDRWRLIARQAVKVQ